jgi:anthranilate phosphoribosyltransferase
MRKEILRKIARFENLTGEEVQEALTDIVEGKSTEGQVGAFIMGMSMKGATVEEITAAAQKFREWATYVPYPNPEELLDTAGTGGDKVDTFNVSTMSAFVAAAAGAKVAKHGNRAVSSKCGSADFLEALGANIELNKEQVLKMLQRVGIAFLFAPLYHPAMKSVAKVRREVGVKSLFNLVGPLSNPTRAGRQIVGVYSKDLVEPLAKVLHNLGLVKAFVVHGLEGLDEVSITGETLVGEVSPEGVKVYTITPEEVGLNRRTLEEIKGGDCTYNVQIFEQILEGKNEAAEDFLVINSAFALTAAGVVQNPKEGVELAREVIRNGKVAQKVEEFVKLSKEV